jgi:hypothetical protein
MQANLAEAWHWTPTDTDELDVDELTEWHRMLVERGRIRRGKSGRS